jgi:hypothetical protein
MCFTQKIVVYQLFKPSPIGFESHDALVIGRCESSVYGKFLNLFFKALALKNIR